MRNKFRKGLAGVVAVASGALAGAGLIHKYDNRPSARRNGTLGSDETPETERNAPMGPFDMLGAGVNEGSERSPKGRVMTFAKAHNWKWLGRTMQVFNRYSELQGSNLAGAVTLQIFIALFPLLIIASSVLGFFVAGSDTDVTRRITDFLGVSSPSAQQSISNALQSANDKKGWAAVIGFVSLLWSALGVSAALQFAYNQAWQAGGRGVKDKAVGLGWMIGAAILFVLNTAAAAVVGLLPSALGVLSVILSIAVTFALWMFTGRVLPNVHIPWRAVVPGAIVGTIGLQLIQLAARFLPGAVGGSSSGAYGAFGVALALIAALLVFGKIIVYGAVTDVVLYEGKHGTTTATIQLPTPIAKPEPDVDRSGNAED